MAAPSPISSDQSLRVHLLGGFAVSVAGHRLPDDAWALRRAAALIKLLALTPGHRLPRDQALDLLWPDADLAAAANSLHRALYVARRALDPAAARGSPYLRLAGDVLSLQAPDGLWVDVDAFAVAAAAARRSDDPAAYWTAVERYVGDLLPDDAYEDWAADRREALRQEHMALLLTLARLHRALGEPEPAMAALRRLVACEPAHEAAQRALMQLYAEAGQGDRALQQYQHLREALARDLDAAPDDESRRLYDQILTERSAQAAGKPGSTGAGGQESAPEITPVPALPRPTASTPARPLTNLPTPLSSFVGRAAEIGEVRQLLATTRLLTITGAGGVGKTRLALEVARSVQGDYPDGVWLVELAALADPALVPHAVGRAVGVEERPGQTATENLVARLAGRRLLLALDNCEHLVDACAALTEALLRGGPEPRVLATSREALGIAGELTWRAPSLGLPAAGLDDAPAAGAATEAVQLFVERARLVQPRFAITAGNAAAVAQICRQLDGIPLAIELAAARLRMLSIEEIAGRLGDAVYLLTGGNRTASPRQQTLRATIDWSHSLLSEAERMAFRRLSVFVGGFMLEAAEAVCEEDVLDVLTRLVDRSLVQVGDQAAGATRYWLLETIRQYAWERLGAAGETAAIQGRHAAWGLALGERAEPAVWGGAEQLAALARLAAEHDNLRAALDRLLAHDPPAGLRLAGCLWQFWLVRGHRTEGQRWLEQALAVAPEPTAARVKALLAAGHLAFEVRETALAAARFEQALALGRALREERLVGWTLVEWAHLVIPADRARARRMLAEGEALLRRVGDRRGLAAALKMLGEDALYHGDRARARALLEESLAVGREGGDRYQLIDALGGLGRTAYADGDLGRARAAAEEGLALAQELGMEDKVVQFLWGLGLFALAAGELEQAEARLTAMLALSQERARVMVGARGAAVNVAVAQSLLAILALRRGEVAEAERWLRASTTRFAGVVPDDRYGVAANLAWLAAAALARGRARRAARLLGACEALRQTAWSPAYHPEDRQVVEETTAAARAALGEAAFDAAWAAGAALTLEQAVAEALADPVASAQDADAAPPIARAPAPAQSPPPLPPTSVPAPLSSFVGRAVELAEARRLLGEARLLTLTGAGGCGKTRLALEAARAVAGDYPDGVWLVELAALADPDLVPQATARVLGVAERPGEPVTEALVRGLAGKRALLVLDNCEHLVEACAALVDEVLRRCGEVRALATSRERLRIAGESAWRVPSLALPGPAALTPAALAGSDAVQLFVARASEAQPGWALTDGNATAVAEICARLDGVPLALELAAARLRVLSVAQVAARLDDAFRLLTGGSRAALPRQQTLRAAIDWSYDLLDESERIVLRRLAVFAGGWTLEAAEAVCAGDGIEAWQVLDLVVQLVDKSLVVADAVDDQVRHRLLETIRQYARDRLVETPEAALVRDRHRAWCLALAEAAEPALWGSEQLAWLDRLEAEHDNLRAALAWSQEAAPPEGLRLAASLFQFWRVRGHQSESRRWLNDLLALAPAPTAARGKALVMVGMAARQQADLATSRLLLEESRAVCRAIGDRAGEAYALNELAGTVAILGNLAHAQALLEDGLALARAADDGRRMRSIQNMLGSVLAARGEHSRGRALLAETAALDRQAGDDWSAALSLMNLGQVAWQQGDLSGAASALRESLALLQALGDRLFTSEAMIYLGLVAQSAGDAANAQSWLAEALALARATGRPAHVNKALWGLGQLAGERGDYGQAAVAFRESLAHPRAMERPEIVIKNVEGLAMVAAGVGRPTPAARLLSAAAAARQARSILRPPVEQAGYEKLVQRVAAALEEVAFAAAWAAGAALTLEQAVAEALAEPALDGAGAGGDDPVILGGAGLAAATHAEE